MNADETIFLKKINGRQEAFNRKKLRESLILAGVDHELSLKIIEVVLPSINDGMSTTRVHNLAFKELRKHSKLLAANYKVKRAILELGPTGFPFEILCSELFKSKGFKTTVGVTVDGAFVRHEVDIYAVKEDMKVMAECKFHNSKTKKNDIKTALYVNSRALDIKANKESLDFDKFAICTNTHFSLDAIRYAEGVGLELISLNKDPKYSMVDNIIEHKVYPITCLKTLKKKIVPILLDKGIVVISQLVEQIDFLEELEYDQAAINSVLHEIEWLDHSIRE